MTHLKVIINGLSPRRTVFDPRLAHGAFLVDKRQVDTFHSEYFGFPLSVSPHIHLILAAGQTDEA